MRGSGGEQVSGFVFRQTRGVRAGVWFGVRASVFSGVRLRVAISAVTGAYMDGFEPDTERANTRAVLQAWNDNAWSTCNAL